MPMLDREEYVEQAYFFRILGERMQQGIATQDLMTSVKEEILATTKLPFALDFLAGELRHEGVFAPAMAKIAHYFTSFQTFVIAEAESDRGKFDFNIALQILEREAIYRSENASPQGIFLYQFESISRNRLSYDRGLKAMADDPIFDADWKEWILIVRRQVGLIDFADLLYVRSQQYRLDRQRKAPDQPLPEQPALFGEKEGRIAWANRGKDPLLLFAALHRHLGYPQIPQQRPIDQTHQILPQLLRRIERLESRLKLVEDEQKGGFDLSKFYVRPDEAS